MNPVLKGALLKWKKQTPFNQPGDFIFGSVRMKGKKPLALMEVFKRHIKPVIRELGFAPPEAGYGWHAFRHGVGTALCDLTRDRLTAVWTGIGAAGTTIIGMIFLGESAQALRIVCIGVIVAGVIGPKFVSAGAQ